MPTEYRPHHYKPHEVERLLGLYEGLATTGKRHVTMLDVVSWASDPGGDLSWFILTLAREPDGAWMARRGPLAPDSEWACVKYDFERAMKRLALFDQIMVGLTVMGFSPSDIAAVIDPDKVLDLDDEAITGRARERQLREHANRRRRIARYLEGRPKRDETGTEIRDEYGDLVYSGGVAARLARLMNNEDG